jgi:predicted nucleic acid-binding protein
MPAESRKVADSGVGVYVIEPLTFADTNVLLYLLSEDARKLAQAQLVMETQCLISVQVLNEMSTVMRRKFKYSWVQIERFLALIRSECPVRPLTVETHSLALQLAGRYQIGVYDALIAAAAILAECNTLYSEDLHHGLVLEGRLRVVNPFL